MSTWTEMLKLDQFVLWLQTGRVLKECFLLVVYERRYEQFSLRTMMAGSPDIQPVQA